MTLTVEHILTICGSFITLLFSIIAVVQATKANKIAKESLIEAQKDHIPILRFVESVTYGVLSCDDAKKEMVFDFGDYLYNEILPDRVPVVKAIISNVGNTSIYGITFEKLYIFEGDERSYVLNTSFENVLFSCDSAKKNEVTLRPGETKEVFFSIPAEAVHSAQIFFNKVNEFILQTDVILKVDDKRVYEVGTKNIYVSNGQVLK